MGVPTTNDSVSKNAYEKVVERVQVKLASWKCKTLSFVGRVTLVKVVTPDFPVYAMQTASLPISVCEKIDKLSRNFIWDH